MGDVGSYKNVLLIISNIINIIYNFPQMLRTYRTKSVNDFDPWFLILRNLYNILWVLYGIEEQSMLIVLNSGVTIFATTFISYNKVLAYITSQQRVQHITHDIESGPPLAHLYRKKTPPRVLFLFYSFSFFVFRFFAYSRSSLEISAPQHLSSSVLRFVPLHQLDRTAVPSSANVTPAPCFWSFSQLPS